MKLLYRSLSRHLKEHLVQTLLTMLVTILVTGMLAVLFHFASGFCSSLRRYALEKNGTYHYKYSTNAGTGVAELFGKMADCFGKDDWFSEVELTEEGGQVYLILTVSRPGFFTSKEMKRKFREVKEACYEETGEIFCLGTEHNYELLAASGDLSKENGIYSFLLVFLVLVATIAAAAILTLGAVYKVSVMQREREIALLFGIGADRGQIVRMIGRESVLYCLVSLPVAFGFSILVYRRIQGYFDKIVYALFRFPPVDLLLSVSWSAVLLFCAACVILFCGLQTAVRASRISPMDLLRRTKEIHMGNREAVRLQQGLFREDMKNPAVKSKSHETKAAGRGRVVIWLARKSFRRFRRRNRPILIMFSVTFTLCLALDGFRTYATEAVKMNFDTLSYDCLVDLYSDDRAQLEEWGAALLAASENHLTKVREAVFALHAPYPFSESGEFMLSANGGRLPDVALLCLEEKEFERICEGLALSGDKNQDGFWGIFVDTERFWWSDGVKRRDRPFRMEAGESLCFYGLSEESGEEEAFSLSIAGTTEVTASYTEESESARMQILVPERVFLALEQKRPSRKWEAGRYHLSLRGNVPDGKTFGKIVEEQAEKFPGGSCQFYDFTEQRKQEEAGIDSFVFLCKALIGMFALIGICGNFTIAWAAGKAREREFATLLSVGMTPADLEKMRLLELLFNVWYACCTGMLAGVGVHQLIYLIYTSEYPLSPRFPFAGLLLGAAVLTVSAGTADLAFRLGSGKKSLSEQLRMEE